MRKRLTCLILSVVLLLGAALPASAMQIPRTGPDKTMELEILAAAEPAFTVTIPATVTLGETARIEVGNMLVEPGCGVGVTVASTQNGDGRFAVRTPEGAEIPYTVTAGGTPVAIGRRFLFDEDGSAALTFTPQLPDVLYAGDYSGTLTFSVEYYGPERRPATQPAESAVGEKTSHLP